MAQTSRLTPRLLTNPSPRQTRAPAPRQHPRLLVNPFHLAPLPRTVQLSHDCTLHCNSLTFSRPCLACSRQSNARARAPTAHTFTCTRTTSHMYTAPASLRRVTHAQSHRYPLPCVLLLSPPYAFFFLLLPLREEMGYVSSSFAASGGGFFLLPPFFHRAAADFLFLLSLFVPGRNRFSGSSHGSFRCRFACP